LQRAVEVERLLAWDAKDISDALGLEALDEDIGGATGAHIRLFRPVGCTIT